MPDDIFGAATPCGGIQFSHKRDVWFDSGVFGIFIWDCYHAPIFEYHRIGVGGGYIDDVGELGGLKFVHFVWYTRPSGITVNQVVIYSDTKPVFWATWSKLDAETPIRNRLTRLINRIIISSHSSFDVRSVHKKMLKECYIVTTHNASAEKYTFTAAVDNTLIWLMPPLMKNVCLMQPHWDNCSLG